MIDQECRDMILEKVYAIFTDKETIKHVLKPRPEFGAEAEDPDEYWIWLMSQPDRVVVLWAMLSMGKIRPDA